MKALDLFCCAGGASMGLHRAGFDVTGVDIRRQPKYPFRFIQGDALRPPVDLRSFDFIWASPPCQFATVLRNLQRTQHGPKEYPNLIPQTRAMLQASGVPFAIENVESAPLGENGFLIMLCGSMFGLQTPDGAAELRRHRLFETSFSIPLRPCCQHGVTERLSVTGTGLDSNSDRWMRRSSIAVTGNGATSDTRRSVISVVGHGSPRVWDSERGNRRRRALSVTGNTPQTNVERNRIRKTFSIHDARAAMGIDWMPMKYLSQAIPPAYSQFIGEQAKLARLFGEVST
jgi:DNA (cytosine-5)-methyltransferase 1